MTSPNAIEENNSICNIYVDASGDDGFGEKASKTFTVAMVIEGNRYTEHNNQMLVDMKRIVGCRCNDEAKYGTIKKHPKRKVAWEKLHQLNVHVKVLSHFKADLSGKHSAILNTVHHAWWLKEAVIYAIDVLHANTVNAYIDGSLPVLQRNIEDFAYRELKESGYIDKLGCLEFVQSRRIHMVQAADIFAGAMAELLEANKDVMLSLCGSCFPKLYTERLAGKCKPHKVRKQILKIEILDNMGVVLVKNGRSIIPSGLQANGRSWGLLDCALR